MERQSVAGIWPTSALHLTTGAPLLSLPIYLGENLSTSLENCFKHEILPILPIMPAERVSKTFYDGRATTEWDPVFDLIVSVGLFYLGRIPYREGNKSYVPRFYASNEKDKIRYYILEAVFQGLQHLHEEARAKCLEAENLLFNLSTSTYEIDAEYSMLFWSHTILVKYVIFLKCLFYANIYQGLYVQAVQA